MKRKTSITLSSDVLVRIDRLAGSKHSRSALIEGILRQFLRDKSRTALHKRDLALINRNADRLNQEIADVMEYQVIED